MKQLWFPWRRRPVVLEVLLAVVLGLLLPLGLMGLAPSPRAQPKPIEFDLFQSRIHDAVRALGNHPRFKGMPLNRREALAELVSGNMLFVLLHELAHAAITELNLPVLGRRMPRIPSRP